VWPVRTPNDRPTRSVVLLAAASALCLAARTVPWWTLRFVGEAADDQSSAVGAGGTWPALLLVVAGLVLLVSAVTVTVFATPPRYETWIAQGTMALGVALGLTALVSILLPDWVFGPSRDIARLSPHVGPVLALVAGVAAGLGGRWLSPRNGGAPEAPPGE